MHNLPATTPEGNSWANSECFEDGANYLLAFNVEFEGDGDLNHVDPGGLFATSSANSFVEVRAKIEDNHIQLVKVGDVNPEKLPRQLVLIAQFPEDGVMIWEMPRQPS